MSTTTLLQKYLHRCSVSINGKFMHIETTTLIYIHKFANLQKDSFTFNKLCNKCKDQAYQTCFLCFLFCAVLYVLCPLLCVILARSCHRLN